MPAVDRLQRILITPGEPAGIGPDIVIQIAQHQWPVELCVIADPNLFLQRAQQINLPLTLEKCDINSPPQLLPPHTLNIVPIKCKTSVAAGQLNPANASYVRDTLAEAAKLCLAKYASAVVTAPVHKGVMNDGGIVFTGHTEFFAEYCGLTRTVMLFVVGKALKVALVTTHLPLAKVPQAITKNALKETISILSHALKQQFKIPKPRILVCGLNPHAGEGGHLGREEIDIISPSIKELYQQGENVIGPLPADTIFTPQYLAEADAIVAMYHDQALSVVKYAGFGEAVNVTLGLPFVRTSVDHGTALNIAGSKQADASSLMKAIELAIELCK